MNKYVNITTVFIIAALLFVWIEPELLSSKGVGIALAWAYGVLIARVLRIILQYGIIHWGFNRYGVTILGVTMAFFGCAIAYFGWHEGVTMYMALGWIIAYAGFDSAYAAYGKKTRKIHEEIMNNAQYVVIALFASAVFANFITDSPVGRLNLEYQGVSGESLLFIALVLFAAELTHGVSLYLRSHLLRLMK